jgi:hypothetical protein
MSRARLPASSGNLFPHLRKNLAYLVAQQPPGARKSFLYEQFTTAFVERVADNVHDLQTLSATQ